MHDTVAGWLDVLGCPRCQGALRLEGDGVLHCLACDCRFPVRDDGIPALIRREDAAELAAFSRRYREARLHEGWCPLLSLQAMNLPYGSPPDYPRLYWEVRRQSYEALADWLSQVGPRPEAGPAADLGAGTGWLAYRLAGAGYRVVAVEASRDEDFGLGAVAVYRAAAGDRLLPAQGNLECLPLRRGALSLAVFNASLHYARDLKGTLVRTSAALRPDGCLVILDTPVAARPRPGTGRGDRHLGRGELKEAMEAVGLRPRWVSVRRGVRWWIHQAKAWLKGDARFRFPMVIGTRK